MASHGHMADNFGLGDSPPESGVLDAFHRGANREKSQPVPRGDVTLRRWHRHTNDEGMSRAASLPSVQTVDPKLLEDSHSLVPRARVASPILRVGPSAVTRQETVTDLLCSDRLGHGKPQVSSMSPSRGTALRSRLSSPHLAAERRGWPPRAGTRPNTEHLRSAAGRGGFAHAGWTGVPDTAPHHGGGGGCALLVLITDRCRNWSVRHDARAGG
jgi:hypothetical protein